MPALQELTLHAAVFAISRMSASTVSSGLPFSLPAPGGPVASEVATASSSASDSIGLVRGEELGEILDALMSSCAGKESSPEAGEECRLSLYACSLEEIREREKGRGGGGAGRLYNAEFAECRIDDTR